MSDKFNSDSISTAEDGGRASSSTRDLFSDTQHLAKLGKKSVLTRHFGFWSILSLSVSVLITWEATLIVFSQGLDNGGTAGLIYSYLFVWAGVLSTFAAMSEVASMAPTAAGQYHWVHILAPRRARRLLSYVTGWATVAGWQGTTASAVYLNGGLVQALANLTVPHYTPQRWQATLISMANLVPCFVIAVFLNFLLPKIEVCVLVLHVAAFVAILTTLTTLGEHSSAKQVFTTFANGGNWPSQGLSVFIGMIGNVFAFAGADAAFHMAEEVQNASIVIPRIVISGIFLNGALGFAMTIALCFSLGSLSEGEMKFMLPVFDIFHALTNSIVGPAVIGSIIIVMATFATCGLLVSSSRVLWSFARDQGVPGWRTVSKVTKKGSVPVWSVCILAFVTCLLTLINIGSEVAINSVLSLSTSSLYISYLLTLALLLYRRLTGAIADHRLGSVDKISADHLVWGPWRIPGIWGTANNVVACMFLTFVLFFSFWPPATPVQADTMNYAVLVTGGVLILCVCYYFVWGKKEYNGPREDFE